jgi:multidrug efflux system outer membrane protein
MVPMVLTTCAPVGPDHATPAMELPAKFSQGGVSWKRETPGTQPKPQNWWRLYNDSTLNSLVDRALAQNQNIQAAAARVREARSMSAAARSRYFPSLDLGAGAERSKMRPRNNNFAGGGIENTFSIPLDYSYEFDAWGKVRRQIEGAGAREAAAEEQLNALRLTVAAETARTYWALRAIDADRDLLGRTVELREEALGLLRRQQEAGSISGLDLSRAETEVATARTERISLDRDRAELVNALAALTGSVATGSNVGENPNLPRPPRVPTSTPGELLRQRPDIRASEHQVAAANADIGVAEAMFYPSFSIGSSAGLDAEELRSLFRADSLVWSLGANALLPITGQAYLRTQRDAAVAAHQAASAEYRQNVLDAIRDVETALQAAAILARSEEAAGEASASANKTRMLSRQRYEAGLVSFLDVVDAERTRLDADRRLNAVRAERLAVSVALIQALGGSWR